MGNGVELQAIPGFSGYFASKCGRIFSTRMSRKEPRELTQKVGSNGYLQINAMKDGCRPSSHEVHALVALAYLEDRRNADLVVVHADDDKTNCVLQNLAWATPKQNYAQAVANGIRRHPGRGRLFALRDNLLQLMDEARRAGKSRSGFARELGVDLTELRRTAKAIGGSQMWDLWV